MSDIDVCPRCGATCKVKTAADGDVEYTAVQDQAMIKKMKKMKAVIDALNIKK